MSKQKWESKMNAARELRKQGSALLYQRVSLLVECYHDPAFGEFCRQDGTTDLDYLDAELDDTATDFLTLMAVLKAYPDEATWVQRNVRELIAEILETQKRDRTQERSSWKERCLAAEAEVERLRGDVRTLTARVSELQGALAIVSSGKRPLLEIEAA